MCPIIWCLWPADYDEVLPASVLHPYLLDLVLLVGLIGIPLRPVLVLHSFDFKELSQDKESLTYDSGGPMIPGLTIFG